ncbi:MAG: phytoene desaturase family protein, partial [Polyangiales bacterium]
EFPEQREGIRRYLEAVDHAVRAAMMFFALKSFPESVDKLATFVHGKLSRDWWAVTTAKVLDECGITGRLRTILTLHWGYYGSTPSESSFPIHALTHAHFWNGAYYPRGGSKEFAAHMLDAVRRAGGDTLVRAEVASLLVERDRAVGVKMADGVELRAPVVISAAGAKTTVKRFVPESMRRGEWGRTIEALDDSPPYICLNMAFEGDVRAAGASSTNLWLFETWSSEDKLWDLEEEGSEAPVLYCSFPSLKDPDHDPGPRQRQTGECVTFVAWETFERWANSALKKRPGDYEALKRDIEARLLRHLRRRIPEIMQHLVYYELSSPITTEHFTRASRGAIYGLAATPARFTCTKLRTRTPLDGFYMTGVDVASLGVVGAMTSGMLTAATLDPRLYRRLL